MRSIRSVFLALALALVGLLPFTQASLATPVDDLSVSGAGGVIYGGHIGSPGDYSGSGAGSFYTLATVSDPDGEAVADTADFLVDVNWGDGSTNSTCTGTTCSNIDVFFSCNGTGCTVTGLHTYAKAGRYVVTVKVSESATDATSAAETQKTVTDNLYFDVYVTGDCSGAATPAPSACGLNFDFTGTEGQSVGPEPVAMETDGDNPPVANLSATVNYADGSTASGTVGNCSNGCLVTAPAHTYQEEGSYNVTTSVTDSGNSITSDNACPATTNGRSSCTPAVATISDAALSVQAGPSGQTCAPYTTCTFVVGYFTDSNPYCTSIPPEEAISPTTGAPHYVITIDYGDGSTGAPTSVTQTSTPCRFQVSGTHSFNSGPTTFNESFCVQDEGGAPQKCTGPSQTVGPTVITTIQPSGYAPCHYLGGTNYDCPSASAAFDNHETYGPNSYLVTSQFGVQLLHRNCMSSENCKWYKGAYLNYRDMRPSPYRLIIPGSCTQYDSTCRLRIDSFQCTAGHTVSSPGTTTVYGRWNAGGFTHYFKLYLTQTKPYTGGIDGTYTIQTSTNTHAYYTYTTAAVVNIHCPS